MKKTLSIFLSIIFAISLNSQAEDFSAVNNDGDTIYYKITSSIYPYTASVTYRGVAYYTYHNDYTGSVSIPDSVFYNGNYYIVTSIGGSAFHSCNALTSVTIGNSVTSIAGLAFANSSLTSVTIPNSVSSIGNNAFENCTALTAVAIPNSLTSINLKTFSGCSGLTSVSIPNSVTLIDESAFQNCSSLSSLTIPSSVITINKSAFLNNTSLDTVYFNAYNCTTMGNSLFPVFKGCNNLSTLIISDSINYIPSYAFYFCGGLTSINIPYSVDSIGEAAFSDCYAITSLTLPSSLISIGKSAFRNNTALDTIFFNAYNCTYMGGYNGEVFRGNDSVSTIIISDSITKIPNYAFSACKGFASITIPNSVIKIGRFAFANCFGLTSLTIPNSVTKIEYAAFNNCRGITSLHISSSCDTIEGVAFGLCTGLTSIRIDAIIPPRLSSQAFSNVNNTIPVSVPCNSVSTYQNFYLWTYFTNIVGISNTQFINDSICVGETYNFNGTILDSAGVYNFVNGCDSVILNLVINPTYNDTILVEICQGEIYNQFGFNESTTGFYTQNLQTINGCDSIVNLNLIINQPAATNLTAEICQGDTYTLNGFNVSTAGLHTLNLQAINGCDSIIELNLVVNPTPEVPHDLSVNNVALNYTIISWQGNADSYDIYRDDSLIVNVSDTTYVDNFEMSVNVTYSYNIKAKNGTGCESALSDTLCFGLYGLGNIENTYIKTKLYPNPTNNKSYLEVEGLSSEADVLVYDMIGRVIKTYKINQDTKELEIDLSNHAKGVYSIRIVNQSINQTKKLIVQ